MFLAELCGLSWLFWVEIFEALAKGTVGESGRESGGSAARRGGVEVVRLESVSGCLVLG